MTMDNKLALTGITNNPGRVLIRYISENYNEVLNFFPGGIRAVYRTESNVKDFERLLPNAEKYICDLTDVEGLKIAFKDIDTVFHIAGIHWSREVFEAAAYCGVRRIITVHTCGIYSKYKSAGEEYRQIDDYCYRICKENGIALTILRPTMIYGNGRDRNVIKFIKMIDKLPIMPVVSGGRYTLQPVHYEDLGKAFYDVLCHEIETANKDFILSGKEPILLRDMFIEIGKNLDKKVHFISCPFWIAYPGAWFVYLLTLTKIDYREKVQRLCENRSFPHNEATVAFGYNPRSFQEGIVNEVVEYGVKNK